MKILKGKGLTIIHFPCLLQKSVTSQSLLLFRFSVFSLLREALKKQALGILMFFKSFFLKVDRFLQQRKSEQFFNVLGLGLHISLGCDAPLNSFDSLLFLSGHAAFHPPIVCNCPRFFYKKKNFMKLHTSYEGQFKVSNFIQ